MMPCSFYIAVSFSSLLCYDDTPEFICLEDVYSLGLNLSITSF